MANSVFGIDDVHEGCVESIDLGNERGVIVMAGSDDGAPLIRIQFPLAELRVSERDFGYVEKGTKVTFKLRNDELSGEQAYEVTPIESELCFAQVYGVADGYCRVVLWDCQKLADVNLRTLKRVVPHHLCLSAKENCIVALPWNELSKAQSEKRFPVVHLLELHDSKIDAETALKQRTTSRSEAAATPPKEERRKNNTASTDAESTALPLPSEFHDFDTVDPQYSQHRLSGHEESPCENSSCSPAAPTRDQLQIAYWCGVRDGAFRYQQLMSPLCGITHPFLNDLPVKYNPTSHLFHHS